MQQSRLQKTLMGLTAAVVIALACMVTWQTVVPVIGDYLLEPSFQPHERLAFTAEAWADATPGRRGSIVQAMLADHRQLRGKSRAEVIALLGKPDKDAPGLLWYGLSDERGGDGSYLWTLIIWFLDDEIVKEVAVRYTGD
jgi:hypothetical protein